METHNNLSTEQNSAQPNLFQEIISIENLFASWHEFKQDKRKRVEVMEFERNLEDNLFGLQYELKNGIYYHSQYTAFYITDPKLRLVHKAKVRDRIVHHAIYRVLCKIFDPSFIYDSYSCRIDKGTHRAVDRLDTFIRKTSKNYTGICFILKCDIKKFFSSVDQQILFEILKQKIDDPDVLLLLQKIIGSFGLGTGIPIGNLTSQLFANVYMNEFDQFVKHKLKVKHYCRYTDDFVIVSASREYLEDLLPKIEVFLERELKLKLHPGKVSIRKYQQGADFLGYIVFPYHRLVRTKTQNRIFKKLRLRVQEFRIGLVSKKTLFQSLNSYLGVFSHANAYDVGRGLKNKFRYWLSE